MTAKTIFQPRRWSDRDHYLGPITFARQEPGYRPLAVYVESGCEEYPGASLHLSGLGAVVIVALPGWVLRPRKTKVSAKTWSEETIKRLGRDFYYQIDGRRYGLSLSDGHFNVYLGAQTMDSSTEQRWSCFLPWTQWRATASRFYGLDGELFATMPKARLSYAQDPQRWEREHAILESVPTVDSEFIDFDGERITATTRIDEQEWEFGTGWFRWLSWFRPAKIRRSLDIRFSAEVGRRKGSWKGGTVGHGIDVEAGELHEAAFRRYCDEHGLRFERLL